MAYKRQPGLLELNTHGCCLSCFADWAGFINCEEPCDVIGPMGFHVPRVCRWQELNQALTIDAEAWGMSDLANWHRVIQQHTGAIDPAPIEAAPAAVDGVPPGFGPSARSTPPADARFPAQGGPYTATDGPAATSLAENPAPAVPAVPAGFGPSRPMVDAFELARRFRHAARACDFEESDRTNALITRALELEEDGGMVPDENTNGY